MMWKYKFFLKTSEPIRAFKFPSVEMCIPFLWREDQNVDSEGDVEGDEKLYKYLQNREKVEETFEVYRLDKNSDFFVYEVGSNLESLAAKAAYFLAATMEGETGDAATGPFFHPSHLLEKIEKVFDLDGAFQRAKNSVYWEK